MQLQQQQQQQDTCQVYLYANEMILNVLLPTTSTFLTPPQLRAYQCSIVDLPNNTLSIKM